MYTIQAIDPDIRSRMNPAYTLRRVPFEQLQYLVTGTAPRAGDLVLARVSKLGHHRNLQLPNRARKRLFVGDYVVVAYADRYASSQFEAVVPKDLGPCHLVAGGGCAAQVLNHHARIRRGATHIEPLGLLTDTPVGAPLNLADFACVSRPHVVGSVPVVAVVGSAMDSGKTTSAAYLARGLASAGLKVGYAKITGTGASGDPGLLLDAGASLVVDFTDAGYASTYKLSNRECECIFSDLLGELHAQGAQAIIVEVADGLLQRETAGLLASPRFAELVDGLLLATCDAMSAQCGKLILDGQGHSVLGLCGAVEASPLQRREAIEATNLPFLSSNQLMAPEIALNLIGNPRSATKTVAENAVAA